MVRILLFFHLLLCFALASLNDVVVNIMGEKSYQINQNFVDRLFRDEKKFFLQNQEIDYYRVIKVLKDNGLLYLSFKEPLEVKLTFKARTKPIFLTRTINNVLSVMGYSYFTISKAKYNQGDMDLTFSLTTEHGIDPEIVLSELKKRGIFTKKIVRNNQTHWLYDLEILNPLNADAIPLKSDDRLELKNVSGEYWFSIPSGGIANIVMKNAKSRWYPRIVLYDRDLQILEIVTQNESVLETDINLSDKTAFMMVTDLNNPARLKSGIIVTFSTFGVKS